MDNTTMSTKPDYVFLFSGQGSQYFQMGKSLYDQLPTFAFYLNQVDDTFYQQTGTRLLPTLYDIHKSKSTPFDSLLHTHIAIVAIEYALAKTLITEGIKPAAVLGVSIGECAAMAITDVITLEEMVFAVSAQAAAILQQCEECAMTAILAPTSLYEDEPLCANTTLAAVNFDGHFIVSGNNKNVVTLEQHLRTRGISFLRLPVRYGFHSPHIQAAEKSYLSRIQSLQPKPPRVRYYSCMTAKIVCGFAPEHPWHAVRQPIRLQDTLSLLFQDNDYHYIDVGPSGTLATMLKYNLPTHYRPQITSILNPAGDDMTRFDTALQSDRTVQNKC